MADGWFERKLLSDMRRGHREAFEEFLDLYEGRVCNLACRMVERQDAEDVAQDALVEICRSIGNFRGESTLSTWVYRVAMNVCLQQRRRRGAETVSLDEANLDPESDPADDPSEAAARNQTAADVDRAVQTLPEIYKDVVVLHEMHGLTYMECAAALGCPVGTVKSRLSEAFRKLRELLPDYASEGGVAR
jgi:RNA polymerase sigma-70 factor (ECF subfamily)